MPFSRPIRSVTNCPSTTSDGRCGSDWASAEVSALAYSTDRAGCVSHPTPTRRCTQVGQIVGFRVGGDRTHSDSGGLNRSPLRNCSANYITNLFRRVRGGFRVGNFYSAKKIFCRIPPRRRSFQLGPTRTQADSIGVRRGIVPPIILPKPLQFIMIYQGRYTVRNFDKSIST